MLTANLNNIACNLCIPIFPLVSSMLPTRLLWLCLLASAQANFIPELAAHPTAESQEHHLTDRVSRARRFDFDRLYLDDAVLRKGPKIPVCCACTTCDGCSSMLGGDSGSGGGVGGARRLGAEAPKRGRREDGEEGGGDEEGEQDVDKDVKDTDRTEDAISPWNNSMVPSSLAEGDDPSQEIKTDPKLEHFFKERQGGTAKKEKGGLENWEERYWSKGLQVVAGTDEAGRGPLAGPVVSAAFAVLKHDDDEVRELLARITDSKQMSQKDREWAFDQLTDSKFEGRIEWALTEATPEEIDGTNILQATLGSMARAASALKVRPDCVLVDGPNRPPALLAPGERWTRRSPKDIENDKRQTRLEKYFAPVKATSSPEPQEGKESSWRPRQVEAVVDGDALVPSISAASVLAKVHRDRRMQELHKEYPVYGFDVHKGYPTKQHLAALKAHGASPHHRWSFGPVRHALDGAQHRAPWEGPTRGSTPSNASKFEVLCGPTSKASTANGTAATRTSGNEGARQEKDYIAMKDCVWGHVLHMPNSTDAYSDAKTPALAKSSSGRLFTSAMDTSEDGHGRRVSTGNTPLRKLGPDAGAAKTKLSYKFTKNDDDAGAANACCSTCATLAARAPPDGVRVGAVPTAALTGLFVGGGVSLLALRSNRRLGENLPVGLGERLMESAC